METFKNTYIMNRSNALNFASADYKIYIMDKFDQAKCAEALANMYSMIDAQPTSPIYKSETTIKSPYELPKDNPVALDIFLNSGGGSFNVMGQFAALFGLAKSKGIIVRTIIPAYAGSCASLLAIQGTPGFRIMGEYAQHLVHFGCTNSNVNLESEIEKAYKDMITHAAKTKQMYLSHTDISERKLKELQSDEYGYLDATECLELGFCDWILKNNGEFISKTK